MELLEKYRNYLRETLNDTESGLGQRPATATPLSVGIVGAGISGLYAALLLQRYIPVVNVTIFEANNRVGGQIYTHKFSDEPYQYCEPGAMRIPCTLRHKPVFQLIEYLNEEEPSSPLKTIDFIYSCPSGNRVLVNGTKMKDGRVMTVEYANKHCSELGFSSEAKIEDTDTAEKLLYCAVQPVIMALKANFEEAMAKYNQISLYQYLINEAGWSKERLNYFDVMCGVTNISYSGLIDLVFSLVIQFYDASTWKTVQGGMSVLPELCAKVVQRKGGKILLNSKVDSIMYYNDSARVKLGFRDPSKGQSQELAYRCFDAVILAIPSPCIRMMKERPQWPVDMEHALRSLHHRHVLKIHLRFKSSFWASSSLYHPPSLGGATVTDLPSRLIIYPSYGIGVPGKAILCAYIRNEDCKFWLSLTKVEKVQLILQDLQILYPEVDIASEYAGGTDSKSDLFLKEAHVQDWTMKWPMGAAFGYFPAQYTHLYPVLAQNRGSIYFAGTHLSVDPTFIMGALESAKFAVKQLIKRQVNKDLQIDYIKDAGAQ